MRLPPLACLWETAESERRRGRALSADLHRRSLERKALPDTARKQTNEGQRATAGGGMVELPASEPAITTGGSTSPTASWWRVRGRAFLFIHVSNSGVHH